MTELTQQVPERDSQWQLDMLNGIATTLQRVTAYPVPKPYLISELISRNREGSNDKEEFRHCMSDPHLWMQAW